MGGNLSKQSFCRTLRRSSAVKTWSPGPKPFFRFFTHRSIRASGRACNMLCKSLSLKASAPWVASATWVAGWQLEGPKIRVTRNRSSLRSSSSPHGKSKEVEPPKVKGDFFGNDGNMVEMTNCLEKVYQNAGSSLRALRSKNSITMFLKSK